MRRTSPSGSTGSAVPSAGEALKALPPPEKPHPLFPLRQEYEVEEVDDMVTAGM